LASLVAAGLLSAGQAQAQSPADQPAPIPDLKQVDHSEGLKEACDAAHEACCRWYNHIGLFGDFLYLAPRGLDVPFARLSNNGCGPGSTITGGPGVTQSNYSPGYRVGAAFGIDDCSCIMATFTRLESHSNASLVAGPLDVIQGLVTAPSQSCSAAIGANGSAANAHFNVDLRLVDLDYKHVLLARNGYSFDWYAGVRYADLKQDLDVTIPALQATQVTTKVDFEGVGPRLGLEGEKIGCRGFLVYGHVGADFLAGNFRSHYLQTNNFIGTVQQADLDDDRIVTVLELELGVGWQSQNGHFRVQVGYLIDGWFNTVNTADFINAVNNNNFASTHCNLNDSLSFDGLVVRLAVHF
jgi:hypothetical protein